MIIHQALADRLWDAFTNRIPCTAPTDDMPELTLDDAYEIQSLNLERRMRERNARLVGRKIGLTSLAIQEWLGVDEPDFGGLLDEMSVPNGGTLDASRLIQPRAEGELAFVTKRPLEGPGITAAQVIAATDFVLPAIEIIDSRVIDWKFRIQDTIADNASSAMFVVGSTPMLLRDVNTRTIGVTLRKNGEVVSTGAGAACLGDPVNAVVWLANKLGTLGVRIEPGEILLSGALGPVTPIQAGDFLSAQIGRMGEVGFGVVG